MIDLSKVTYSHTIEDELIDSPRDHFEDPEQAEYVLKGIATGNPTAWCGITVTAQLGIFQSHASLWCCSYDSEQELLADLLPELKERALEDLLNTINNTAKELFDIGAITHKPVRTRLGALPHE